MNTASKLSRILLAPVVLACALAWAQDDVALKADGQATVAEIVKMLEAAPSMKVAIEGHTDNVGQPAANKALSEARAKSVMAAVVAGGIDAKRLSAAGFGQEKPIADNRGEEGRAKNRRVELVKK